MNSNSYKYTCIFGGGAIRGMAYIGAMRAMEEVGITSNTIAGSSVGAIFAGLLAVGYKAAEIEEMFMNVNFDLFRDIHFGFGKSFALSKGEVFLEWVREMIEKKYYGADYQKGGNPTVKFKDLGKNLVIITTDLTNFKCKEFSKFETPDFEVASAIRISSSMPGLMVPMKYEDSELVDGDLQKSWPLWRLSPHLCTHDERVLEFRLEGDYDPNGKSAIDYLNTVYSCVTSIATDAIVRKYAKKDKFDYIIINTGEVLIVDFSISTEKRRELINIGYNQTMKLFKDVLPIKKERLISQYKILKQRLDKFIDFMEKRNVNDAKIELGLLYMDLFTLKPTIDKEFIDNIQSAKFRFVNEVKPTLLFGKYPADKIKSVNEDFKLVKKSLDARILELSDYINEN